MLHNNYRYYSYITEYYILYRRLTCILVYISLLSYLWLKTLVMHFNDGFNELIKS